MLDVTCCRADNRLLSLQMFWIRVARSQKTWPDPYYSGNVGHVFFGNLIQGDKKKGQIDDDPFYAACPACQRLRNNNIRILVTVALIGIAMFIAIAFLAWKVFFSSAAMPAPSLAVAASESKKDFICYYKGVPHTVGSTVDMPGGTTKQCNKYGDRAYAEWGSTVNIVYGTSLNRQNFSRPNRLRVTHE